MYPYFFTRIYLQLQYMKSVDLNAMMKPNSQWQILAHWSGLNSTPVSKVQAIFMHVFIILPP